MRQITKDWLKIKGCFTVWYNIDTHFGLFISNVSQLYTSVELLLNKTILLVSKKALTETHITLKALFIF